MERVICSNKEKSWDNLISTTRSISESIMLGIEGA